MTPENESPLILLLVAHEPLARVLTAYLQRDGCRVVRVSFPAAEGAPAAAGFPAKRSPRGPPCLVLIDLDGLSVEDQGETLAALIAFRLILLTSDRVPRRWLRDHPGAAVLAKPFAMRAFRRKISEAVRVAQGG